jgi:hypothetical protein
MTDIIVYPRIYLILSPGITTAHQDIIAHRALDSTGHHAPRAPTVNKLTYSRQVFPSCSNCSSFKIYKMTPHSITKLGIQCKEPFVAEKSSIILKYAVPPNNYVLIWT